MQQLTSTHITPGRVLRVQPARSNTAMCLTAQPAHACCHARTTAATPAPAAAAAQLLPGHRRHAPHALALRRCSPAAGQTIIRRTAVQPVRAMVNVDVSPSVVLGVGLIGAGVSLWQIRRVKPWISKDYDVVVSCISLLVGGILIFQGWRLDPLLLFGQLMTTGAAVSFAIEALRLRSEMYESEEKAALQDVFKRKGPGGGSGGSSFQLPPPEEQQQAPWGGEQGWAAAQQWQPPPQQQQDAAGFYDYQQQQQPVASSSGYGYDHHQQQQQQSPYGDGGAWGYGAGQYQMADYDMPPPAGTDGAPAAGAAGDYFVASGSNGGSSGAGPTEFTFPASYDDVGPSSDAAGSTGGYGSWSGGAEQQQWGNQQQQQRGSSGPGAPAPGRGGAGYDMDDW